MLTPARVRDPDFLAELAGLAPDCCPVVAYGALVPAAALAVPPRGWVNLHFSLLPAWRGAAPAQHAVMAGDEMTGATTFLLEEGLDTGPVLGVLTETVRPADTAGDLLTRLAAEGARLLLATLDGLESGELTPVPQSADGVSLAPKLSPDDVRVDWSAPAARVDRLVRAATPAPGAWTTLRDKRVKLGPVQPVAPMLDHPLAPGALRVVRGQGVLVGTATTPVRLGEVRPEGAAAMAATAWANGLRLTADDRVV